MKAREWERYLQAQRQQHGKVLFTITELAHVSGSSRNVLNVELNRLCRQGIAVRYDHGLYGLPDAAGPEELVQLMDSRAYITASYALLLHGIIAQVPARITCFTNRRSPRARVRQTPVGQIEFVCIRSRVYNLPPDQPIAPSFQALCDFVYLARRQGVDLARQVTFRNLDQISGVLPTELLERYPSTVRDAVTHLFSP